MKHNKQSRRPKDEMKHAAILKAATRLFLKNGYTNTSMDAIADAARVTKQTVYSHYSNKDALFTHMVASLSEKQSISDALLQDSDVPVEQLLYDIGLSFLNLMTSREVLATTRLVIVEAQLYPKLAERYYEGGTQHLITLFSGFLARQNKRRALAIPDTASAASYFLAMLKGRYYLSMILSLKQVPSSKDKEMHVRETVSVFLRIYGGKNAMHTKSIF